MKAVVFEGHPTGDLSKDRASVEVQLNDWLSKNPNVEVKHLLQSEGTAHPNWLPIGAAHVTITLLYEQKKCDSP